MSQEEAKAEEVRLILLAGFLSVILVQLARAVVTGTWSSEGIFHDSDVYMYMVRVEALWEGRGWFVHLEDRINPPEGHVQHWTRPLDFLLLAGGALLAPIVGFREGLAFWTALISPVLHLLAMVGVYQLARLVMSRRDAALSAGIFGLQFITIVTFLWGRGDHHSLLGLGQVFFFLGLMKVFLQEQESWKWSIGTGVIGAFSLWVNAEALGFVLVGLVMLGLWWLVGQRDCLRAAAGVGLGLFGGTVIATVVERGPTFFHSYPIDTIGIAYVTLFGLTALFFVAIWQVEERWKGTKSLGWRVVLAVGLALGVLGALFVGHPEFFRGPLDDVDPLYQELRLSQLSEQGPALRFGIDPPLQLLGYALVRFGILVPALLGVGLLIRETSRKERWVWAMMTMMALAFGVLAMGQVRWLAYLPLGAALGAGVLGGMIIDWFGRQRWYSPEVGRPLLVMSLLLGITVVGLAIAAVGSEDGPAEGGLPFVFGEEEGEGGEGFVFGSECEVLGVAEILNQWAELHGPGLILVEPDRGSEILYRTDHNVLSIANHRFQPGFKFFVEVMRGREEEAGVKRLQDRGVDLVMVCPGRVWSSLRGTPEEPSMKEKWAAGQAGEGLEVMADPSQSGGWWIYEVLGEKGASSGGSAP